MTDRYFPQGICASQQRYLSVACNRTVSWPRLGLPFVPYTKHQSSTRRRKEKGKYSSCTHVGLESDTPPIGGDKADVIRKEGAS